MPITILLPSDLAEICTLSEALFWVAFSRFPLPYVTENKLESRIDPEYVDGLTPYIPNIDTVTDEECILVGLPLNPEYQEIVDLDSISSPVIIRDLLLNHTLEEEERQKLEQQLIVSLESLRRQKIWQAQFESFMDVHEAKLFVALREGRLPAKGRKLPRRTYSASLKRIEATNWEGWEDGDWELIPPNFWVSKGINWMEGWAEGNGNAYGLIIVETESLLKWFAPPQAEAFGGVVKIANDLVLVPNADGGATAHSNRGRPSFDWDGFHVEVARRLTSGAFPQKQEALIADMQHWCKSNWNRDVGRSTLLQKLKPYYDAFAKKSENPDK